MPPPKALRDTFVKDIGKPHLDLLTRVIVLLELVLGLNRLALFGVTRRFLTVLGLIYTVVINGFVIYVFLYSSVLSDTQILTLQLGYLSCTVVGAATCKRLRSYYIELNRFDYVYGWHPKKKYFSLNLLSLVVINLAIFTLILIPNGVKGNIVTKIARISVYLIYAAEFSYYGHLFHLLLQRIQVINLNIKTSFDKSVVHNAETELKKQTRLYHILIDAYNLLSDSINWQFVIMITMSFLFIISLSYSIIWDILNDNKLPFNIILVCVLAIAELTSLFSPCLICEQVHNEVKRLRENLSSRFYYENLDKSTRSTARTLLALTETPDLTFVLFRTLYINMAFPFKYMKLLVTYLIIYLQFKKVINTEPK